MKTAVIGIGRMGGRHSDNLACGAVKGAELTAVCDLDANVTRAAAEKYGVKGYSDYRKLIEDGAAEAVVVATPHYSHEEICAFALEHGIHVLVEKPIAVEADAARRLIEVAGRHSDAIFAIMYNQRTNPMYAYARELVGSGRLGKIQRADFTVTDWYRSQFYYDMNDWRASWSGEGGGTLINQCVHQLDLLQWILGMPGSVLCRSRTKGRNITTENDVTAVMNYGDFDCVFRASTHEIPGVNRLEIAGSKGSLTVNKKSMTVKLLRMDESEINGRSRRDYGNKEDKKYRTERKFYGIGNYLYDWRFGQQCRVLERFAEAVNGRDPSVLVARGEEGIYALELINAMNMSAWKRAEVALPVDGAEYSAILRGKIEEETNGRHTGK